MDGLVACAAAGSTSGRRQHHGLFFGLFPVAVRLTLFFTVLYPNPASCQFLSRSG